MNLNIALNVNFLSLSKESVEATRQSASVVTSQIVTRPSQMWCHDAIHPKKFSAKPRLNAMGKDQPVPPATTGTWFLMERTTTQWFVTADVCTNVPRLWNVEPVRNAFVTEELRKIVNRIHRIR